jgi:ribosomal peptide maturation radical SAM protein 1
LRAYYLQPLQHFGLTSLLLYQKDRLYLEELCFFQQFHQYSDYIKSFFLSFASILLIDIRFKVFKKEILDGMGYITNNMSSIRSVIPLELRLGKGDALLIVPPFSFLLQPCYGVHLLQSCARSQGYEVKILYANLLLAALMGQENYETVGNYDSQGSPGSDMLGERFFASAAYNLPPFGSDGFAYLKKSEAFGCNFPEIKLQEQKAALWADEVANLIAGHDFKAVGCSTSFNQTACSIALLNRVKQLRPDIVTIIGGSNCEGAMAIGIQSLSSSVDYVFSGECESTFPEFLGSIRNEEPPSKRIQRSRSPTQIEDIPLPDYADFFQQSRLILSDVEEEAYSAIFYESSRGCWWGEKHKCAFCGLNGENNSYRYKSAARVFSDLRVLREKYPGKVIQMTDNILPMEYFKSLVPMLEKGLPNANLFYEVRPNLSLRKMMALKRAGIYRVQAGIESLSTPILRRMRKGTTAHQNLAFLRYAISVGLYVAWNIMIDLPGEQVDELEGMINLMLLLRHLQPPDLSRTAIERFSLFFLNPGDNGLTNIRPVDAYFAILPEFADVESTAYDFQADYASATRDFPDLGEDLRNAVKAWRAMWTSESFPPSLAVVDGREGEFMLLDTRELPGTKAVSTIGRDEAKIALAFARLKPGDELLEWAIKRKLVVEMDEAIIPLATGNPKLILQFEKEEDPN